ncbi:dihydrofolate reductase family protein [Leisingera sp. NJS204]|uniref:dihydrofolate reductase family protein n=1 Tax=Leisingera sp. NJS204 TaxID=2508307 RepID=UPI0010111FF5|nr:dihydrofolate reductase family protein [Leisingera sp. NJS204]QAX28421.1 deaminase [Leisingera sp. NJS204]
MQQIIYDVAISIDGYISGPGGDISQFAQEGAVVEDYSVRLETYATAIMGRATYEFGYRFGMQPGQNPYAHMETIVLSKSLGLPDGAEVAVQKSSDASAIDAIKTRSSGPIYLCGGGTLAGSLLSAGHIDVLRLKRAPIILGEGVLLFGGTRASPRLQHTETRDYGDGYLFQEFRVSRKE